MVLHPELGSVNYEVREVSDDPQEQVAQVVSLMRGYAVEDAASVPIRREAQAILLSLPPGASGRTKAEAVWRRVRSRIRFQSDDGTASIFRAPPSTPIVEALIRPVDMASMCNDGRCNRVGDCDDYSMYEAALLTALGIDCSYVTVAADPTDVSRFSHVYVVAYVDGERIPLDASHGPYPGWEAPQVYGVKEWTVRGGIGTGAMGAAVLLAAVVAAVVWAKSVVGTGGAGAGGTGGTGGTGGQLW